jgi:hypothetical protein
MLRSATAMHPNSWLLPAMRPGNDPPGTCLPGSFLERERELDWYRTAVERYLGPWLTFTPDEELQRFFDHVERCFDWGISAPACGRTWIARVHFAP